MDITTFIPPGDLQIEELVPLFNYEVIEHVIVMALEMRGHHSQRIEHHAPVDSYNSGQTVVSAKCSIFSYQYTNLLIF